MKRRLMQIGLIIGMMMGFAACEHKLLCDHDLNGHGSNVWIDMNWFGFTEEEPTGMTVIAYPIEPAGEPIKKLTNNLEHVQFNLKEGIYSFLVFNQSDWEFGGIDFRGMDAFHTAEAYAVSGDKKWKKPAKNNERICREPEWLATDIAENIEVTKTMSELGDYTFGTLAPEEAPEGAVVIPLEPENVIYTLTVRVHLRNVYNLRNARAAVTGLAEGYLFAAESTTDRTVTHLVEEWSLEVDKKDATQGVISGQTRTFGLPKGHAGKALENELKLQLLLVDNKTIVEHELEVGDLIKKSSWDDDELTLDVYVDIWEPLPDVEPEDGVPGGFDATVEDWGPEEDYEVDID